MLRYLLLCFAVLAFNAKLAGQQIEIYGKILDESTNEPIPFANVAIAETYMGTSSNINGNFLIKIDSLPVRLIFSHVSYDKKVISVENTTDLIVKLTPGKVIMDELVIEEDERGNYAAELIYRAYNKASSNARKNHYGLAYYRQTSQNGEDYSELYEIFYDTRYSGAGIVDWEVQEGRYAMSTGVDKIDYVYNKNFTLLTRIFSFVQPATDKFINPINPDVALLFDLEVKELKKIDGRRILTIGFTPKEEVTVPAMEGIVAIDIDNYDIIEIKAEINNDSLDIIALSNKDGKWQDYRLKIEAAFKSDTSGIFLDHIILDQYFGYIKNEQFSHDVHTQSFLTYYEYYQPEKFKRLGGRLIRSNRSDREILNKIGYNRQFWENNPVVLRTPIEEEIIASFEAKNSFGSIYLNDGNQVQLEIDDAAKDPFLQQLNVQLIKSKIATLSEKVYLHMDKAYYATGETVWFKAYVTNLGSLLPSEGSVVLYVDIIDPDGNILIHKRLPVNQYGAEGSFDLPEEISSGQYRIRAYTNWMKNYSEQFFFDKNIAVYNPNDDLTSQIQKSQNIDFDVQFFAEGGQLIVGIPSQVAFKAIDQSGAGIDVSGNIFNSDNNKVAELKTRHDGMGSIFIIPQPNEKLKAIINYRGIEKEYFLPEPVAEGYNLTVNNLRDKNIQVMIKSSTSLNDSEFYLVGQSRGIIYHREKSRINRGSAVIQIPKLKIPDGIFHITIFNMDYQPVGERAVFINNQQMANAEISVDDPVLSAREKIKMKIRITNEYGKPVKGIPLSLAVTDIKHQNKSDLSHNIGNYLLLTSDLKGYIHDPGFYFLKDDRETRIALDLLMLTHGWTRFSWDKIQNETMGITEYSHEMGINVAGMAFGSGTKNPFANGYLTFISADERYAGAWMTTTDNFGHFQLNNLQIPDTVWAMTKSLDSKGKLQKVDLTIKELSPFPAQKSMSQGIPLSWNSEIEHYLETVRQRRLIAASLRLDDQVVLKEVLITGKRQDNMIYGTPDAVVEMNESMLAFNNIFEILSGRVAGVTVSGSGMNATVRIRGQSSFTGATTPLFLLDGIPLTNSLTSIDTSGVTTQSQLNAILLSINPRDVDRIEVLKNPGTTSIFGVRGGNGVISIITQRETIQSRMTSPKGFDKIQLQGYSWTKEYYAPKYDVPRDEHVLTDKRTTVYWNPGMFTDNLGYVELEFFNSDEAKQIQVDIQGMSDYGDPIYHLEMLGESVTN